MRRLGLIAGLVVVLFIALLGGGRGATAQAAADQRYFSQTGYRIDNDALFNFFSHRGGIRTFGYPISETFTLLGSKVQFFQRRVLQLKPEGSVDLLNLLDPDILPYTRFNGSTFPAVDPALTKAAPVVSSSTYAKDALTFVTAHAPNTVNGAPVNFGLTFLSTVSLADAFPGGKGDAALLPLMDLELWGLPTSAPTPDPANAGFIYLRFQRGIMQYNAATGLTQAILLGDYLKAIITGQNLPLDLAQEAVSSRYFQQWAPGQPQFLARPAALPNTNLTNAFYQQTEAGGLIVPTATSTPLPTATPTGDFCVGDELMAFAGAGSAGIGDVVYVSVTSSRNHTNVLLTGPDGPVFIKQYVGQRGFVWQWQVAIKSIGRHDYTYYVDTSVPCTTNFFEIPSPTSTPGASPTPTATGTAAPTPSPTPTAGQQPTVTAVNPTLFVSGQVITVMGGPFGSPPPGSGPNGTNGMVFFFFQPGSIPTPGPGTPTPTPFSGSTRGVGSVLNWTNGFITVQVPPLTPSLGANGSYCVQVSVNGAPTSNPFCGLQVSG